MECWQAPDLSQTRTSRLAGLDIVRPGPDQTIDCHGIFPHGSWEKTLVVYLVGSAWCRVLISCSNRTKQLLGLSTEHNWWDWVEHSRKSAPTTTPDTTKLFSCSSTCCSNGRNLFGNSQVGIFTPLAVFTKHCSFWLPFISIDDAWPVWAALHIIWKKLKIGSIRG